MDVFCVVLGTGLKETNHGHMFYGVCVCVCVFLYPTTLHTLITVMVSRPYGGFPYEMIRIQPPFIVKGIHHSSIIHYKHISSSFMYISSDINHQHQHQYQSNINIYVTYDNII